METEVKFIVPDETTFKRLRDAEHFGHYIPRDVHAVKVHDSYIDTPSRNLFKRGFSARLRQRKGGGGLLLTLKRLASSTEGALHTRDEYEAEVPGADPATWPESDAQRLAEEFRAGQSLEELVAVDQVRIISMLYHEGRAVAEASLDEIEMSNGETEVRAFEMEVELRPDGSVSDLMAIGEVLTRDYNLVPQPESKFERAVRLVSAVTDLGLVRANKEEEQAMITDANESPNGAGPARGSDAIASWRPGDPVPPGYRVVTVPGYTRRSKVSGEEERVVGYERLVSDRHPEPAEAAGKGARKTPFRPTDDEAREIYRLHKEGMSYHQLAARFKVSPTSAQRIARAEASWTWLAAEPAEPTASATRSQARDTVALETAPEPEDAVQAEAAAIASRATMVAEGEARPKTEEAIPGTGSGAAPEETAVRVKTKRVAGVLPDDTIAVAVRKLMAVHGATMLESEEGTRDGEDTEALHDMRVSTRRMRAVLKILGPYVSDRQVTKLESGLRDLTRALGLVRELDVLTQHLDEFREKLPVEQAADLEGLTDAWNEQRASARRRLVDILDSKGYARLRNRLQAFIDEGPGDTQETPEEAIEPHEVRHVAGSSIWKSYEAVRAFETIMDAPTIPQVHALRVKGKYLRYTVECFREVMPSSAGDIIRDVTYMQDQIGNLHDADFAAGMVRDYVNSLARRSGKGKKKKEPVESFAPPAGVMLFLSDREDTVRQIYADFFKTWKNINGAKWRARLASAIAAI